MSSATSILCVPVLIAGTACSVTRPVAPTPTPANIQEYLAHHPKTPIKIVDSTGRSRWIYEASLRGDTLRGLATTTMPRTPIAMDLRQVSQVAAPRFSATRTLGLLGGLAALLALYALALPEPVY